MNNKEWNDRLSTILVTFSVHAGKFKDTLETII